MSSGHSDVLSEVEVPPINPYTHTVASQKQKPKAVLPYVHQEIIRISFAVRLYCMLIFLKVDTYNTEAPYNLNPSGLRATFSPGAVVLGGGGE